MWVRCLHRILILLIIGLPLAAQAATVTITEVMFDPVGSDANHEWVRIQNTSTTTLDLKGWKLAEGGVNHKLTPLTLSILQPSGYAIIAEDAATYRAEHPGTTDIIFDSSFSLNNTGETVELKDASSTVLASYTYTPVPPAPKATPTPAAKKATSKAATVKATPKFDETNVPIASAPASVEWSLWPWLVGLGLLIAVGIVALFVVPKRPESGYEIIDTSDK